MRQTTALPALAALPAVAASGGSGAAQQRQAPRLRLPALPASPLGLSEAWDGHAKRWAAAHASMLRDSVAGVSRRPQGSAGQLLEQWTSWNAGPAARGC